MGNKDMEKSTGEDNSLNKNISPNSENESALNQGNKKDKRKAQYPKDSANKSRNTMVGNHSRQFLAKNYSTRTIVSKYLNLKSVTQNFLTVRSQTLDLELTVNIFKDRLDAQANVWARKLVSYSELNLRGIIGTNQDRWISDLEKCFVYSYFSALFYAISTSRVRDIPAKRCFIKGHFILYNFLVSGSYSFRHDDFNVNYNFRITEEKYKEIFELGKKYSYIKDHLVVFPFLSLENDALDRILGGLKRDLKTSEHPSIVYANEDSLIRSYLGPDTFPIGNSFYTNDKDSNEWSFSFNPDTNILDKTTLFGKACFLSLSKKNEISDFYDKFNSDDNFSLIKYEVITLCGSDYPDYVKSESLKVQTPE